MNVQVKIDIILKNPTVQKISSIIDSMEVKKATSMRLGTPKPGTNPVQGSSPAGLFQKKVNPADLFKKK